MQQMINELIEVLEIQSFSKQDKLMREYLMKKLSTIEGVNFYDDGNNIYAIKGSAPYPCVVSHIDTVHKLCSNLTAITIGRNITGFNAETMEQTGVGGDDKVGVFVCLQMLKEQPNLKVVFFRDEEIGCIGSGLADHSFFDDVTIVLQCDRRGNSDFITNAGGVELSSPAFQAAVLPILRMNKYKFADGLMTDVQELKEQGILPSMANISCGYYNPHSPEEYVNIDDVARVIDLVAEIIDNLGYTYYPHEHTPRSYDQIGYYHSETNWWDEPKTREDQLKQLRSLVDHSPLSYTGREQVWCQDCAMRPATGPKGFCDSCFEWHSRAFPTKFAPKPKPAKEAAVRQHFGRRKWKK